MTCLEDAPPYASGAAQTALLIVRLPAPTAQEWDPALDLLKTLAPFSASPFPMLTTS